MGTRLYPKTEDPAILEKLANVQPGTFARLETLKTNFRVDIGEQLFQLLPEQAKESLRELHRFAEEELYELKRKKNDGYRTTPNLYRKIKR